MKAKVVIFIQNAMKKFKKNVSYFLYNINIKLQEMEIIIKIFIDYVKIKDQLLL